MAKGFPDWESPINITNQNLGYVSMRPVYGGCTMYPHVSNITPMNFHTLASITGIGMIYGGYIAVDADQSQANDYLRATIDGVSFFGSSFSWANKYGLSQIHSDIFHLLKFDDTLFIYAFGIANGYPFDTSLLIEYSETYGNTFIVWSKIFVALF